jgi:hypothetical protein
MIPSRRREARAGGKEMPREGSAARGRRDANRPAHPEAPEREKG